MNSEDCENGLETSTQFLSVIDSQTGAQRKLAYRRLSGRRTPGIVYIAGFMGKKDDVKPLAIDKFCFKHGFPYVRYDATGLGESQGPVELKDARFSHWLQDAEEILLSITDGPQLVVGSSMGGWIAALLAKKYPEKFANLLLLAPTINFGNYYINRIKKRAPPALLELLEQGGHYEYDDPNVGKYPVSFTVFEEMIPYELPLEEAGGYSVQCPVRIIHGTLDTYSPFENSLKLVKGFETNDIQLLYLKGVDHNLESPETLKIINDMILKMANASKL